MAVKLLKALLPAGAADLGPLDAEGATVVPYSAGCSVLGADSSPVTGLHAALALARRVASPGDLLVLHELETGRRSRWLASPAGLHRTDGSRFLMEGPPLLGVV
jgi:hypothetical protein